MEPDPAGVDPRRLGAVALVAGRRSKERELSRREEEVAPVRKLAFEDITAFGEDLQELDLEMSGHELDAGANADYQRALDAYESAKLAGDSITQPDDIRHITEIIEDGRYAVACVRASSRGRFASDQATAVLLRPASRALGRRGSVYAAGRGRAGRTRLRPGCRARPRGRRS